MNITLNKHIIEDVIELLEKLEHSCRLSWDDDIELKKMKDKLDNIIHKDERSWDGPGNR